MKKKLFSLLSMVLILALMLIGCKSGDEAPVVNTEKIDISGYHVAMITDSGDITDESFNQVTYEATRDFCAEYGVTFSYYKPVKDTSAAKAASIVQAIEGGANVVVMPGYSFTEAIVNTAPKYSNVKFIAIDISEDDFLTAVVGDSYDGHPENYELSDYVDIGNVYGASYREEISGYMAGYATVKMGYEHLAFVGGIDVPAVKSYGAGYVQGANDAAAELGKTVTVDYVYTGTFQEGNELTASKCQEIIDGGAQVIFSCGGSIYKDVCKVAQSSDVRIIGVDVDQAASIASEYKDGMTITSATKGLGATVKDALTSIMISNNWDTDYAGHIVTLGMVSDTSPEDNYCQLAESTQYTDDFTYEDYLTLVSKIYSGQIIVSDDTNIFSNYTCVNVNDYGILNK